LIPCKTPLAGLFFSDLRRFPPSLILQGVDIKSDSPETSGVSGKIRNSPLTLTVFFATGFRDCVQKIYGDILLTQLTQIKAKNGHFYDILNDKFDNLI
jgi:hypothetical protein